MSTWGDVAANLKFERPDEFGASPRYDADHWSSVAEGSIGFNQRWERFDQANFKDTILYEGVIYDQLIQIF